MTLPTEPVVVASALVGGWAAYGYVAGISGLADVLAQRRARKLDPTPPPPVPVLSFDPFDMGSWVNHQDEQGCDYPYGDGLDTKKDLRWWEEEGRACGDAPGMPGVPAILGGMGLGR